MDSNYYLEFENTFRGNRRTILDRLSMYDSLIDLVDKHNSSSILLDIGCGRGELLERWYEKLPESVGIESDLNMIKLCRERGLNVIEGDALEALLDFKDSSVACITIFHLIEHLDHKKLFNLIKECNRVLSDNGVLIMETPNIDSLLVSTKSFYLDPTHITHINPDGLVFSLQQVGFDIAKYYYINGGPLKADSPLKITRILNGVAQDLLIVATKNAFMSNTLFNNTMVWNTQIDISPNTLQAAIEYDLEQERLNNLYDINSNKTSGINDSQTISELRAEIALLKSQLKYLIKLTKILKTLLYPFLKIFRNLRRNIFTILRITLDFMLNFNLTRDLLSSKKSLYLIRVAIQMIPGAFSRSKISRIYTKLQKLNKTDSISSKLNNQLLLHYKNSSRAKEYKESLDSKLFKKKS